MMGSVVPLSAYRRKSEAVRVFTPPRRGSSATADIVILPVVRIERREAAQAEASRVSS